MMRDVSFRSETSEATDNILEIEDLRVDFRGGRRRPWSPRAMVHAVSAASLAVPRGRTVGLVGESGSGKTTIGRAVLRLVQPTSGTITAAGFRVDGFRGNPPAQFRRAVQAVLQDPLGSMDPLMTVEKVLAEPVQIHFDLDAKARGARVRELLDMVGLSSAHLSRYPHELSGGQRQRVAIAKALAVDPELIVLDEPVSSLDVSVQSQIVNLLGDIQRHSGISYLLIAHDLAVVRHASHEVAVMYRGRIMEAGPADRVCGSPRHPYTRLLFEAAPDPIPRTLRTTSPDQWKRSRPELGIEPIDQGCPFFARCSFRRAPCATSFPEPTPVPDGGSIACFAADQVAGASDGSAKSTRPDDVHTS